MFGRLITKTIAVIDTAMKLPEIFRAARKESGQPVLSYSQQLERARAERAQRQAAKRQQQPKQ